MFCTLTADPLPEVQWIHDGKAVIEDAAVRVKTDVKELDYGLKEITYSLEFPAGRHVDTGEFVLKAKNKYGFAECSARLDILLKPEITGMKDQIANPEQQIVFEVIINANPKPQVSWVKDGENLCNNDNCDVIADVEKEIYRLVVHSAGIKDHGTYKLTATNNQGETIAQAELLVHGMLPLMN